MGYIREARAEGANLYTTDSIDKGCQFFKYSLGLFPLGRNVIIHCLKEMDSSSFYSCNSGL